MSKLKIETIEEKTYRILKWIYGAQPSFKSIKGTNDFKLRCAMIELAITEEREACKRLCKGVEESNDYHGSKAFKGGVSVGAGACVMLIENRSFVPAAPKYEVSE